MRLVNSASFSGLRNVQSCDHSLVSPRYRDDVFTNILIHSEAAATAMMTAVYLTYVSILAKYCSSDIESRGYVPIPRIQICRKTRPTGNAPALVWLWALEKCSPNTANQ